MVRWFNYFGSVKLAKEYGKWVDPVKLVYVGLQF